MSDELEIKIKFTEPSSAVFTLEVTGNVLPNQLLMLGSYFEFEGKLLMSQIRDAQIAQEMQRQERNKIVTPKIAKP